MVLFCNISNYFSFYGLSNVSGPELDNMSVDGEQSIPETQLEVTVIPETQMDAADMRKIITYSITLSTFQSNVTDC